MSRLLGIDTTSNYVEHEEVVADRLIRVARAVGDLRSSAAPNVASTLRLGSETWPLLAWEELRALLPAPTWPRAQLF